MITTFEKEKKGGWRKTTAQKTGKGSIDAAREFWWQILYLRCIAGHRVFTG
ncbi:hypothetical protein [Novipirellula sp.]|uniref:hypothetical protein n=1 Tax=Novipirellula sp. TaxID=2795430 RepID=UPI003561E61D